LKIIIYNNKVASGKDDGKQIAFNYCYKCHVKFI